MFIRQIEQRAHELDVITARAYETICGPTDETQDVELYDGTLGVSRQFVDQFERPMGQLKWLDDLAERFVGPNDSPGNISGQRWGSGGLIAPDLFLTAGHCFDQEAGAWGFPRRNGNIIAPSEIATLMEISFGYQVDGTAVSRRVRDGDRYPVVQLLEYRMGGLDCAIVRVGRNLNNAFPGESYGWYAVAEDDITQPDAMLCLIQHPNGQPKRVEAGPMRDNTGGRITYDSLDTTGGSSGALILHSPSGAVVGVHTNGGCTRLSGFNYGVSTGVIRLASSLLARSGNGSSRPAPSSPTPPASSSAFPSIDARLARIERVSDAIAQALAGNY